MKDSTLDAAASEATHTGPITPELFALGKRAAACKGWRWMPGMLVAKLPDDPFFQDHSVRRLCRFAEHRSWLDTEEDPSRQIEQGVWIGVSFSRGAFSGFEVYTHPTSIPDLSDPATLGCLLALVREQPGWQHAHTAPTNNIDWGLFTENAPAMFDGATEAEALVAALEAAP